MSFVQGIVLRIAAQRGITHLYDCDQAYWTAVFEQVYQGLPQDVEDRRWGRLFDRKGYQAMSYLPGSTAHLHGKDENEDV